MSESIDLCNDDFYEYIKDIEENSKLYMPCYLGFPWYQLALERISNSRSDQIKGKKNEFSKIRLNDFNKKIDTLRHDYEYIFITKSKQYRRNIEQKENFIFYDIFCYLKKIGKKFIIFEIPENSEIYDTRYLESIFSDHIIPYEHFSNIYNPLVNKEFIHISRIIKNEFNNILKYECERKKSQNKFAHLLINTYINMTAPVIKNYLIFNDFFNKMNAKCLFGAMGTHYTMGLKNKFVVTEVGHGFGGGVDKRLLPVRIHDYFKRTLHIDRFLALMPKSPFLQNRTHKPSLCLSDNVFNYGMPELRNYTHSEQRINKIKTKYNLHGKNVILITTQGGVAHDEVISLVNYLSNNLESTHFMIRQHPTYDKNIDIPNKLNISLVNNEHLYDILSCTNVIISPPSSIAHEASIFTDNIIICPRKIDSSTLKEYFPSKNIIRLNDLSIMKSTIEKYFMINNKKEFQYSDNYNEELDRLFDKIEANAQKNISRDAVKKNQKNTCVKLRKNPQEFSTDQQNNDDFINPPLSPGFCDLYIVRKAIIDSINKSIHFFHGTLLDVGCGQMPYREHILAKNPNITRYIGLDFAQGKYADLRQPDLTWDGHTIPLADASVDCAMATEVLEHCFDPSLVLQEIKRVLKPGGAFFFTVPFLWPIHDAPHNHYRYTPYALERLLAEAGFNDIRIEALGGWNAAMAQMIGLWLRRAPMAGDVRAQLTKDLYPFFTELIRTDAIPTDFSKNPMVTGLSGTAKAAGPRAEKAPNTNGPRVIVVTDQFPVLSQTFILDQMTGLIDRGLGVEHWSLQRMDEPVVHENVHKYGLLDATRYITLPPDSLRTDPTRWTEQFLRANNLSPLDDVTSVQIHFGPNFNKLAPLFEAYPDLFVLVSFHGYDGSATFKVKGADVYAGLFARANQITTPSQYMKNTLVQYGCPPDKIVVHHYGKDIATFSPANRPERRQVRLLSVARFVEKKGLEYSLTAFAKAQTGLDAEYRIVGYGPLEPELKALVKTLDIENQVRFLGQLTNDAVRQEMATADIFVLTSVTASNGDQEGVPVSLIEAQALGLPVVSSQHAGIPELVAHGETGFLAEERNVDEIAGFMRVLIKNSAIRKSFSINARERVLREFDLAKLNDTLAAHLLRRGAGHEQTGGTLKQGAHFANTAGSESRPDSVYCPICRTKHDQFRPFGKPPRPNAMCPNCTSLERHRAIWLFLERHTDFFTSPGLRMLHFAPEACLEPRFRHLMGKRYVTADLLNPRADVRADITNLQFPDASFDAVLCSHVLEHVPDDHAAMRELYRVLDKDGIALVMVPLSGAVTVEDLSITDPEERVRRYGQADHVRYYGMDITGRLQAAGFAVQCIETAAICAPADFARMRFSKEKIFLCRKQSKSKTVDTGNTTTSRNATDLPPKATTQALCDTARHWSSVKTTPRTRWWMHPAILRHINAVVCGEALDGPWAGLEQRMRGLLNGKSFTRGLSVGCGSASKELHLLQEGIVGHFDLFEISAERIALGQASAARRGVTDRANFHAQDAFAQNLDSHYDLVYWNNALHHMFDVRQALHWSRDRLRPGGWLVMDDYVGGTRFQWPEDQLDIASRVRRALPERLLRDPAQPQRDCATSVKRPRLARMLATDPSEAADSANILPALREIFPEAQIMLTGGVVYNLALENVIANFDDIKDANLLQELLIYDAELAAQGQTQYACAFAVKDTATPHGAPHP